ncbi:MAG: hypothetical protein FKY71_20270 [Spiribacter salinus]|uniref:Uncharacterized protein n=1 Tax=Spiribacter salinus TaxID=1335746 RepID=A0A540V326_9GAMM|nr:MAG: hypothetical protein FKY71_20270 [Spiribacter salinus]
MTYIIHSTLIDNRDQAIKALAEAFLSADGFNDFEEIRAGVNDAENTADELIAGWGGTITTAETDENMERVEEPVSREEWIAAIRAIDPSEISDET